MTLPSELQEMLRHIQSCEGVFRPSAFWDYFDNQNIKQIQSEGIENFKRTINQNYFNWLPTTPDDNQFKALLRLSAENCSTDAFMAEINIEDDFIESLFSATPLGSRPAKEIYRLYVGMLWEYTKNSNSNRLTEVLEEPPLGNPIPIRLHGRLISQDLANSIRERNAILSVVEVDLQAGRVQNIVEVGAGYGRLAHVIMSTAPCRYTIVDIPPALYVAQWYLTRLFNNKPTFKFRPWEDWSSIAADFEGCELAFVTPDQFAKMPDRTFEIGIAISNLAEMTQEQVSHYLNLFDKKVRSFTYIKQWISSENTLDAQVYVQNDFDMPAGWSKSLDRVDAVQDRFFETLWKREGNASL